MYSLLLCALLAVNADARAPLRVEAGSPQSDSETLFNQAVAAYQQNQFTPALEKFQQVSGPHAQEAQQYIGKINVYKEAVSAAKSILDRSADERDARSLAYAIEQLESAIKIKPDGPWQPAQLLEKARALKAEVEREHAESSKSADRSLCDRTLAAAQEHHYKEAAQLSCLLADDNPGYSCGGDEAVHLCELNTELAKIDKSVPVASPQPGVRSTCLDQAQAAYEKNEFERARSSLQRCSVDSKIAANEFLDKISRYNNSFASGEKLGRDGQYEQARAAFLEAAGIKSDGPGDPQKRAALMELFLGLDRFYSGDYVSAIARLQDCARANTEKQPLVRFYLGASELARFFATGGEDSTLRQDALDDLKLAKKAGFQASGQDVSPRILQVYRDLTF